MPCTISYIPSPVVAYCQRCHFPIHENEPSWRVTNDDILCPYFNARGLVFCTKDCLERTTESVLTQIKRNRSRRKHTISMLAKAHLTERTFRLVHLGHFLWWLTTHATNAYNTLLAEYHAFCKQQSEKTDTL